MSKDNLTIKKLSENVLIPEEEQPYKVPQNWVWVKSTELLDIEYGKGLPKSKLTSEGYPVYGANGKIGYYSEYTQEKPRVLMTCRGATCGTINVCEPESFVTNNSLVLKPKWDSDIVFLKYLFETLDKKELISGSAQPQITLKAFENYYFPLPPFKEQSRIADKLKDLLLKINEAKSIVEEAKATFEVKRAAILDKAFRGGLTEKWRIENSGRYLVVPHPIKEEGQGEKNDNPSSLLFEEDLPQTWKWVLSNELFSFVTSGSRGWAKYYNDEGDIFIRVGNLSHESIGIDLTSKQLVNPPEGTEGTRTLVQEGDILVSITADVGRIAIVPKQFPKSYINQHIALARPSSGYSTEYLAWYLSSRNGGRLQFDRLQRGATKAGLGLNDIKNVWVPLPPLEEQYEIVRKINSVFDKFKLAEKGLNKALHQCEVLKKSILSNAFRGKLGTNDPNEEAFDFLKEILTEKVGS